MDQEHFFEDYDEAASRLASARHEDFDRLLVEWFDLLDEAPLPLSTSYRRLKELAPWNEVGGTISTEGGGMVGSSTFNWPRDRERRLSAQLNLFRHVAGEQTEAWQFFYDYFYAGTRRIDDSLHEMTDKLFVPFARDLRRHLERASQTGSTLSDDDRTAVIDRESKDYETTIASLDDVERIVCGLNDLDDRDRDRMVAEIRAGRELLAAATVRIKAIQAVLLDTLRWIAVKFAEHAVGIAAGVAITYVLALLGIG